MVGDRPRLHPSPIERRNIFGITFEQGYNDLDIREEMLQNVVTENKELSQQAKNDMLPLPHHPEIHPVQLCLLCQNGMTIGVGAGQQSRIHCTRLAGNKADIWWLRQHPKVLGLQFVDNIRRPDRDNAIDIYISDEHDDVLAEGVWQNTFKVKPEVLTSEEKAAWIARMSGVTVGSDAFFPFGDNVGARPEVRRAVHRPARRLHPGRSGHRHRGQVRHGYGVYRDPAVPSLN